MTISRRFILSAPVALLPAYAFAADDASKDVLKARRVIDDASYTVEGVREETARSGELDNLLLEAVGVLIIPKFYKAGFIIGGAYGDGVLVGSLPPGLPWPAANQRAPSPFSAMPMPSIAMVVTAA